MTGKIKFEFRGVMTTYTCTCETPDPEPSEVGVRCYSCGATGVWPKNPHREEWFKTIED